MSRTLLVAIALVAGCTPTLTGTDGFTVGRALMIPCADESGDDGALLVVESLSECWVSQPGERFSCEDWRPLVRDNPEVCTDQIVFESPSQSTLTGFFGPPLDPSNYLAAATTKMFNLPCNPGGPFAEGYPGWEEQLVEYAGSAQVVADKGDEGRLDISLTRVDTSEVALEGEIPMGICR
jgi:hypothetical protein